MAYTNVEKVRELLGPDYDGTRSLKPFVSSSTIVIDKAIALATANGETIDATTRVEAAMWVAAGHYIRADRRVTSESTLSASGSYKDETPNDYLQTAKDMDDNIAAILDGSTAGAYWLGKTESEQLTYDERNGV